VAFVVPQEGAVGWLDSLAIPADIQEPGGGACLHQLDDRSRNSTSSGPRKGAPSSANAKANAALPDNDFNKQTFADPAVVERVKFMKPLSDETRKAYTELWQDVKTAQ
jgi:spermidine/putrescine transport system substrate-binding protein